MNLNIGDNWYTYWCVCFSTPIGQIPKSYVHRISKSKWNPVTWYIRILLAAYIMLVMTKRNTDILCEEANFYCHSPLFHAFHIHSQCFPKHITKHFSYITSQRHDDKILNFYFWCIWKPHATENEIFFLRFYCSLRATALRGELFLSYKHIKYWPVICIPGREKIR